MGSFAIRLALVAAAAYALGVGFYLGMTSFLGVAP